MSKKPRLRCVQLLYKKTRYRVFLHCIPVKRHFLRLSLEGAAEPLTLQVRNVTHEVAENGRVAMVQLLVWRSKKQFCQRDDLVPRFHTELKWQIGSCPPCSWDSVRLRQDENSRPLELKLLNVRHDIDQARRKHTIMVEVIDASPKRVFSDEDIERAMKPPEQPYEPVEVPW